MGSRNYNDRCISRLKPFPMKLRHPRLKIIALSSVALFAMAGATAALPASPGQEKMLPATSNQLPSGDSDAMRDRIAWERAPTPKSSILEQISVLEPAPIEISSSFGWRKDPLNGRGRRHSGIDFPGRPGANVYATGRGWVRTANWVPGYGNLVEIAHANGLTTRYGHLSSMLVSPGGQVSAGQVIGRIGSTGRSTGPHLHYEVRVAGVATDPRPFMRGSRIDYLVEWAPGQDTQAEWNGWSDQASSELPQSVIK